MDTRYAITSKFVDSYWNFGPNAVVFINACWSGFTGDANGAQGFFFACHQKGAGAYLGWTAKIASPASENLPQHFVDRMTAANSFSKESPDQRPFFVTEIVKDMHDKGIVPAGPADLVVKLKSAASNIGLRPTIEFLLMSEVKNELYIMGKFGDQPGEVRVADSAVTVKEWTNEMVTVQIPKSGVGSSGDVIVKVHGKESNKRQLTKWTNNISYFENGDGNLRTTVTIKLVVRGDLAKRRSKPGETIKLVDPIPLWASPESTCSFSCTGERRDGNNKLIEAWSGGGALPLSLEPITGPTASWVANGAYDPATGEIAFGFICGGPKVITGDSPATVIAGGAVHIQTLNTTTWVIPGHSEPGPIGWTWSSATPTNPPKQDLQY